MSQIGIKLANHDFFPIIDEEGKLPIEKELELTTVRDNQESVQINLFKHDGEFDPVYIGSLILEGLTKLTCGDATIFLKLKLDEDKKLHAQATDKDSGNKQSLTISVNDLDQLSTGGFNFDDFDSSTDVSSLNVSNFDSLSSLDESEENTEDVLESNDSFDVEDESSDFDGFQDDTNFSSDDTSFPSDKKEDILYDDELYDEKEGGFPTWLKIFLVVLFFGILALVVALFLKNKITPSKEVETIEITQQDELPEIEDIPMESMEELNIDALTTEAPQKEAEPFPVKENLLQKEEITPPNDTEEVKKEEVEIVRDDSIKKAVRYRIRWGDTLWDISGNFYKNPWAYKRISRYNKIKNPHKIIAGTYITIPAK